MPKKHVDVAKLHHRFRSLDAPTAVEAICAGFGASCARVIEATCNKSVADLYDNPWIMNPKTKAIEVRLRFMGGPPGQAHWITGSLLALLIDHMAYAHLTDDIIGIRRCLRILGDKVYHG